MGTAKKIAKNTSLLLISQVLSYAMGFIYTIYMARYLGVENFGIFSFALALSSVLGIFTDLGLNTLMTREIARDRSKTSEYINNIFSIKLVLATLLLILTVLILNLTYNSTTEVFVIYFIVLSFVFSTFSLMFYAMFQGYEILKYQSIAVILNSSLMLIGVFLAMAFKFNVIGFAFIYSVVSGLTLIYNLRISSNNFVFPKFEVNWDFWRSVIGLSLQFGLIGVFATVYVWIDSIMLFFMQGNIAVGLYNAAYRIIIILLFIPNVINVAVFPVMSRFYVSSNKPISKIFEKYFKLMLIIGIPMGLGVSILSSNIINILFGNTYSGAANALQILIWATVFTFLNATIIQLFQSTNKQMVITKITGLCMLENIALNLVFIPKFSYIAASFNTVITEFTVLILLILVLSKGTYRNTIIKKNILNNMLKIILSSAVMGLSVWYFKNLNLLIPIIAGIIIYFACLYVTRVVNKDDITILTNIWR
ncbi:MAG: flippase [Methanobacterium paludis]|nr:flippase [Methanobacterium paludis]